MRTVERWVADGLPHWKPARLKRVLIKLSEAEAWLMAEAPAAPNSSRAAVRLRLVESARRAG